ncbi:MAG: hypothetical protein A2289_06510 [Deltaproteobacteria bacterium RIFOXYA12_FULL_58_15]|nr:MAG: hypothetical protein A2289_06510 [Deltaproteobacteria bacterium RIFOXYA12_FULL_58_15]OGR13966.1 MAG: hypothetical protein A2341_04570 [Deltaproteobacteria bacterium RIFOXYB12_FULL_58_9]
MHWACDWAGPEGRRSHRARDSNLGLTNKSWSLARAFRVKLLLFTDARAQKIRGTWPLAAKLHFSTKPSMMAVQSFVHTTPCPSK